MENYLPSVVIALAVIALVIVNQLRVRRVTPRTTYLMPLILAAYGIGLVVTVGHGRFLDPAHPAESVLLLTGELVAAVALGWVRARTVRVWTGADGRTWRQGDGWTVAAWAGSILVRLAFLGGAALLGIHSETGLIMVFFGLTFLAQNLLIARRAQRRPITATVRA